MSLPAEAGGRLPKVDEGRRSLGNYVKRMSSVFKRDKPSKKGSGASLPATASPIQPEQTPREEDEDENAKEQVTASIVTLPQPTAVASTTATTNATTPLDRHAMQQERARALFAKYGLTLEAHDWITPSAPMPVVQRVEKPIRMRVHRSCHRCGSLYGADKTCEQCDHKRCKKCPRYPPKKKTDDKTKAKDQETDAALDKHVVVVERVNRKKVLTLTTRTGAELAFQPPKQRIRRSCHKCETLFSPATATVCDACHHVRCTQCPREPAKRTKWPAGYPGDVEAAATTSDAEMEKQLDKFRRTWRKPRMRVRWQCEQCYSLFVHHARQCPGCGHERCGLCTRSPAKKTKTEEQFDPHIVAAVEAKLRALGVADDSSQSSLGVEGA